MTLDALIALLTDLAREYSGSAEVWLEGHEGEVVGARGEHPDPDLGGHGFVYLDVNG